MTFYTFANATTSIPLANLDANFATPITLGNTAVTINGTFSSIGNLTLNNATIASGNSTVTKETVTTITSPAATNLTIQSAGTTAMTIDTSQNVGIGTTSQFGAGKTCIYYVPGTTTGLAFLPSTNASGPTPCNFLNAAGSSVGSITTTASATAYNTSSDYRLKENVQPMTTGLAKISALKPVTYDWISDKSHGEGFIAHELQAVVPAAVTGEKDAVDKDGKPIYQGVDYSKIVVHLVAAVQELKAEFDAYKASHP